MAVELSYRSPDAAELPDIYGFFREDGLLTSSTVEAIYFLERNSWTVSSYDATMTFSAPHRPHGGELEIVFAKQDEGIDVTLQRAPYQIRVKDEETGRYHDKWSKGEVFGALSKMVDMRVDAYAVVMRGQRYVKEGILYTPSRELDLKKGVMAAHVEMRSASTLQLV